MALFERSEEFYMQCHSERSEEFYMQCHSKRSEESHLLMARELEEIND